MEDGNTIMMETMRLAIQQLGEAIADIRKEILDLKSIGVISKGIGMKERVKEFMELEDVKDYYDLCYIMYSAMKQIWGDGRYNCYETGDLSKCFDAVSRSYWESLHGNKSIDECIADHEYIQIKAKEFGVKLHTWK